MRISKYVHSCLLVDEKGKTILIDPGVFSTEAFDVSAIKKLDYLLITHEHQDHMDISLVKAIVKKFKDVRIVSNDSVVNILKKEGIEATSKGDSMIELTETRHEKLLGMPTPENVMFTIAGRLSHPGDSHSFGKTAEILALPVQAPWGSFFDALEKATELKPKIVLPIHDWHWSEPARKWFYNVAESYLKSQGIKFVGLETGEGVEL